jgi:PPOX class probable F420-dependent enzyme
MPTGIPKAYWDLFDKKGLAYLATLMPTGQPQVTPVWCDFDGHYIWINSVRGLQKDRNIRREPRVTLVIQDPDTPYRYLEVRGRVVEITEEGAVAHKNRLTQKYMGLDTYPYHRPQDIRVIYKIEPVHVTSLG